MRMSAQALVYPLGDDARLVCVQYGIQRGSLVANATLWSWALRDSALVSVPPQGDGLKCTISRPSQRGSSSGVAVSFEP
jgi:hypothetical protein